MTVLQYVQAEIPSNDGIDTSTPDFASTVNYYADTEHLILGPVLGASNVSDYSDVATLLLSLIVVYRVLMQDGLDRATGASGTMGGNPGRYVKSINAGNSSVSFDMSKDSIQAASGFSVSTTKYLQSLTRRICELASGLVISLPEFCGANLDGSGDNNSQKGGGTPAVAFGIPD